MTGHPTTIIILYCIATAVAIASRRLRVPYTVSLLVVGVVLGGLHLIELPQLTRELLFAIFLPGLLFEAAYHLEIRELRENARTIGTLAVPGVVLAVGVTAAVLMLGARVTPGVTSLDWRTALLFGCVIAATDPVAVTALFRQLHAPRRLLVLIESESLLNDGTSIVFLTLMVAYFTGVSPTPLALLFDFVRIVAGGALIGYAIGWGVSHIRTRIDDAAVEIMLTTIAAYGSFVAAEQLHCSGVIATVAAGIECGRTGRHHPMTAGTRAAVDSFWEWLAFALNSAVFMLLGAAISLQVLARELPLVLLAAVAALVGRGVVVFLTQVLFRRSSEHVPAPWGGILVWGGLRGALSLVLALSLPEELGNRDLVVAVTGGAVFISLLVQGLTMPALLRKLGVAGGMQDS